MNKHLNRGRYALIFAGGFSVLTVLGTIPAALIGGPGVGALWLLLGFLMVMVFAGMTGYYGVRYFVAKAWERRGQTRHNR